MLYVPVPTARVEGATFVWKILLEKYEKEAMWFFLFFFLQLRRALPVRGEMSVDAVPGEGPLSLLTLSLPSHGSQSWRSS